MFRRIHWIFTSFDSPTKVPFSRCLNLEVHGTLIEYESEKAKLAHYLIQIINNDNSYDQWQEWSPELRELVTNPAFVRAIGFYNIYYQSWALIEQEKTLMHCGNTTFAYDNKFKEYMKVEGTVSENIFDYLFDIGVEKVLIKEREKLTSSVIWEMRSEHLKQLNEDFDNSK